MKPIAATLLLALAATAGASAQAVVTGPLPNPPQPTNQTATLIFNAMMAVARAAQTNPQNAQAAALSYQQAVQRYRMGDVQGARAAALQAMFSATRFEPQPLAVLTPLPAASYGANVARPFPIAGSVGQIDADAFVAQARGAVANCVAAHAPNTAQAQEQLAAGERAAKAANFIAARAAAKAAVDLCAHQLSP
jgi:hypothetical protein